MLTPKSRTILQAILDGYSYEEIVSRNPGFSFYDIYAAAGEALAMDDARPKSAARPSYEERINQIHLSHPRAYEKWSPEEDEKLKQLFSSGKKTKDIAHFLSRQPSAITSRLKKLNLA